jgi:hypothetical protein
MQKKKLETFYQLLNKGEIEITQQPSSPKSVMPDNKRKITEGIRSLLDTKSLLLRELYADSYLKILQQKTIEI